jgi:hypothetical protein
MTETLRLGKYSIGVGDRFARQGKAQLEACRMAAELGVEVIPVWNKSNREHTIIGSTPADTRAAADQAVLALGWSKPYFVDADHISLQTVDKFMEACDFFTLDVAEVIGQPADPQRARAFTAAHPELLGEPLIPGLSQPLHVDRGFVRKVADKYLAAVEEAGRIYRRLAERKGQGGFITEMSMDETDYPQTPAELIIILVAAADEGIPIQTIAPKFTGRFDKGVDYRGDLDKFRTEFSDDLAVIAFATHRYRLPGNLKLSVHSGSDKFSLYGPMHDILKQFDAGVHLKTAGTTWLEELTGLAEAGGEGLELAKEVYATAYAQRAELCAPYAAVVSIDPARLPEPGVVANWSSEQFVSALRHDLKDPFYNRDLRQLLHVAFRVAAGMGDRYLRLLAEMESTIARNVTSNLFERHIRPLFLGPEAGE